MKRLYLTLLSGALLPLLASAASPKLTVFDANHSLFQQKSTMMVTADGIIKENNATRETQIAKMRAATRAEGEFYTLSFNFTPPTDDKANFPVVSVAIVHPEWGFQCGGATAQDYDYSAPVEVTNYMGDPGFADGEYEFVAICYEQMSPGLYFPWFYYGKVSIDGSDTTGEADFTTCKNKLEISAVMGNGEPFPTELDPEKRFDSTMVVLAFGYNDLEFQNGCSGRPDAYVMCNDFPEGAYFVKSFDYADFGIMECSSTSGGISGPFTESFSGKINPDSYMLVANKTSLSPRDRAIPYSSMAVGNADIYVEDYGDFMMVENSTMTTCFTTDGTPKAEMKAYASVAESHVEGSAHTASGMHTGFLAYDNNCSTTKLSGNTMRIGDQRYVVGWDIAYDKTNKRYSLYSPAEIYNINPDEQDIVNFLYPLYVQSDLYLGFDRDSGDMWYAYANFYPFGMFHEKIQSWIMEDFVVESLINGEPGSLDDLQGVNVNNGLEVYMKFAYPDGWVQDQFACEYVHEIYVNCSNLNDCTAPQMTGYQVRRADGKISGYINPEEGGTLYVSTIDYDANMMVNTNATTVISVAPAGSDDWTTLDSEAEDYGSSVGTLYSVDLLSGALEKDTWYTVRVTATDQSGNYTINTLPYCFNLTESSSVKGLENVETSDDVQYFNLQGVRVENPQHGIFVKVANGKAEKVMIK